MYFVFSYAIHNYRVKLAWDDRELEFKALESDMERIKSGLNDEEWLKMTELKIKASSSTDKGTTLRDAINEIVSPKEMSLSERVLEKSMILNRNIENGEMETLIGTLTSAQQTGEDNLKVTKTKRIL